MDYTVNADTSGGNVTITLPLTPNNGRIVLIYREVAANVLTIARNGNNINGAAADVTVAAAANVPTQLQFVAGYGWQII
jgi:hypothetical protein